jgi:hypothetical protein
LDGGWKAVGTMLQIVEEEWEALDEGFMPLYTELRLE